MILPFIKSYRIIFFIQFLGFMLGISSYDINADVSKDFSLDNLATNAEKASYCYYSQNLKAQMVTQGINPLDLLKLARNVKEWEKIRDTLLPESSARTQVMAGVLTQFNQQQEKLKNLKSEDAKRKFMEKNNNSCAALLVELQAIDLQPETASKPVNTKPVNKKVRPAQKRSDLVGNWVGQLHYTAKRGNVVEIGLWLNKSNQLAGVAQYTDGRCLAYLTEKELSQYFIKFDEQMISGKCQLVDHINISGTPKMSGALFNDANGRMKFSTNLKQHHAPDKIQKLADLYHDGIEQAQVKKQNSANTKAKKLATQKAVLQKALVDNLNYSTTFDESSLIGAWQGEFHDSTGTYMAELALWSGKMLRQHQLVGYIRLLDQQCVAQLYVPLNTDQPEFIAWTGLMGGIKDNCTNKNKMGMLATGSGLLELAANSKKLRFYYNMHRNFDGVKPITCMEGLPRDGCYALGIFTRTKLSDAMQTIIAKRPALNILEPDKRMLASLQTGKPPGKDIQQLHLAMMEENRVQLAEQKAQEERERQEQRQAYLAKKQQKEAARQRARMNSREYQDYLNRPPKEYDGPFNNLSQGQYLNAIYAGDFEEVSRQDKQYANNMKELTDETAKQYAAVANLFSMFGAKQFDETADRMANVSDRISLGVPVLVSYMHNYDTTSKRCLRKDAIERTIRITTPGSVTRDGFGREISRVSPTSRDTVYKMNKEFDRVWQAYGLKAPTSPTDFLADGLYNDGKMNGLYKGVKQMMKQHPCDGDVIKKMEQRLLELFSHMTN